MAFYVLHGNSLIGAKVHDSYVSASEFPPKYLVLSADYDAICFFSVAKDALVYRQILMGAFTQVHFFGLLVDETKVIAQDGQFFKSTAGDFDSEFAWQ